MFLIDNRIVESNNSKGIFYVTKDGIVLPKGSFIPDDLIENIHRQNSYGDVINGKFVEQVRVDPPTPVNTKGPQISHFHLKGNKEHIFDIGRWPWWK